MENKKILVNVHSMVDVITNSSTELFIVDENKVTESMKELFKFIYNVNDIDFESTIEKWDEVEDHYDIALPEEYKNNTKSLYIINASYHNELLNKLILEYFNPIDLKYN